MKLLLLLASFQSAFAGPPGQRDGQEHAQAWFVHAQNTGDSYVSICAEAPSPAEADELAWLAHSAFGSWLSYSLFREFWHEPLASDEPVFRNYARVHEKCDGTEDLTIYYGVENERVTAAKQLYDNPLAFSHLESYDEQTGRGIGFIWIARAPEVLFHQHHRNALVLHELGHAFGNDHVAGTIMDADIAGILHDAYVAGKPFTPAGPTDTMGEPLGETWIDLRRGITWSDLDEPLTQGTMDEGSDRQRALALLTGQTIHGAYELRLDDKYGWPDEESDNYTDTGKGRLLVTGNSCFNPQILHDGHLRAPCSWEFKIAYGPVTELTMGEQQLFRRVFRGRDWSRPLRSTIQPGTLIAPDGSKIDFLITRNVGEKIDFSLLKDGKKMRRY